MTFFSGSDPFPTKFLKLVFHLRWSSIFLIALISGVGFIMLYSASGGNWMPWAYPQLVRFSIGMIILISISCIKLQFWRHISYPFYAISFLLLVGVETVGAVGMGAQRWIDLGFISIQPSELMKIALILALARYFSGLNLGEVKRLSFLIPPLLMILAPAALVLRQPDLGTALLLSMIGLSLFFAAGVPFRYFAILGTVTASSFPIGWHFLREYQKNRILTFLEPERDPLGAGYHILQSKIALGSGGFFGKGYMGGTQSHLNFLPEKQTDFIFTMFSEEFGFLGAIILLVLYIALLVQGFSISLENKDTFGKLVALGIVTTLFIYVFINMSMVMGLVPVVGVPLPFVSYGGTALLTLLISFGILLSVDLQRNRKSI